MCDVACKQASKHQHAFECIVLANTINSTASPAATHKQHIACVSPEHSSIFPAHHETEAQPICHAHNQARKK